MVLDTSALLAILLDEPERPAFNQAVAEAESAHLSVASLVEASIVLETRFGAEGVRELDLFLQSAAIDLIDVDVDQARAARQAYRRFGRGRHEAGLNYGDCFAYALARVLGQTLLFKGDDFSRTDAVPASI